MTIAAAVIVAFLGFAVGTSAIATAATTPTPAPTVAPIAVPTPAPRILPQQIDLAQRYQGHSICDPVAKPGILLLKRLLLRTYGKHDIGTTRNCADDPTSEHTEGRALDWMVTSRSPETNAQAEGFLAWLLAPGADGTPAINARRMGVMYIGWNNQIWRGYPTLGWGELKGCEQQDKSARSWDTYCHRDHVHISLTWDGAGAQTSYWDGSAQVSPPCANSRSVAGVPAPVLRPFVRHDLPANRLLVNTMNGAGRGRNPCRLTQPGYSGGSITVPVRRAGVPADASKVLIEVVTHQANAPAGIRVWPTNGPIRPPLFTAGVNAATRVVTMMRIGAGGTVTVQTDTGDTDLVVWIKGYVTNH